MLNPDPGGDYITWFFIFNKELKKQAYFHYSLSAVLVVRVA